MQAGFKPGEFGYCEDGLGFAIYFSGAGTDAGTIRACRYDCLAHRGTKFGEYSGRDEGLGMGDGTRKNAAIGAAPVTWVPAPLAAGPGRGDTPPSAAVEEVPAVEASAPATRGCRHRGTIHIVRGSYGFIRQDRDADDLIVTRA